MHLVGDIHQPLHAADNGDLGGNRVRVALDGDYQRDAEAIVRERLLPAGGLLANLLNETIVTH